MMLAKAVENDKGMVLCGPGTELTDRLLMRFENMQVSTLYIKDEQTVDPSKVTALRDAIEQRFSLVGDCSVCTELKQVLLERLEKSVK